MYAVTIDANGLVDLIEKPEDQSTLKFLQSKVGGLIQPVDLFEGVTMYVNEEGKFYSLAENHVATVMAQQHDAINIFDYIAGKVVIVGFDEDEGDTIGLTDEQIQTVIESAIEAGRIWHLENFENWADRA